jgi:UDP-GlcNAc:undecaprenyl-phosphate GlcNAc-1-phosphate transferase
LFPQEAGPWLVVLERLWAPVIWVFLGSLMLSLLSTPLFRWVAMRKGIWDKPDEAVKIHRVPIPYLGGCAIWLAWTVSVVVYCLIHYERFDWYAVGALVGGGVVAFGVGLVDDLRDIRPRTKLIGQALAGAVLLLGGVMWFAYPSYGNVPLLNLKEDCWFVLAVCLVIHFLVVLGATNATNLLDGLDGLCSGVTAIISMGFLLLATALMAWATYDPTASAVKYEYTDLVMVVSFALAGAVIGFLPYNFNPARIFMGDAGSVFIGYVLAAMMIMFASKFGMVKWFVGAIFIFGLPILDTGVAVIRRVVNRRPIMMPDRSHLYNQLVDRMGLSIRTTVGILYGLSAVFAAAGLIVLYLPGRVASLIYAVSGVVFLLAVWRMGFLRMTPQEKEAAERYLTRKRGD